MVSEFAMFSRNIQCIQTGSKLEERKKPNNLLSDLTYDALLHCQSEVKKKAAHRNMSSLSIKTALALRVHACTCIHAGH